MEPTQIKTGSGPESGAAPDLPTSLELAYERAPTLLGGSSPGAQGEVRVWKPGKLQLSFWVACPALLAAGWLWLSVTMLLRHNFIALPLCSLAVVFQCALLARAWSSRQHPCYLTTDATGIGITTRNGSRALRWPEITIAEQAPGSLLLFVRGEPPEEVRIDLLGYIEEQRKELLDLLIQRACLSLDNDDDTRYLSHDESARRGQRPLLSGPNAP